MSQVKGSQLIFQVYILLAILQGLFLVRRQAFLLSVVEVVLHLLANGFQFVGGDAHNFLNGRGKIRAMILAQIGSTGIVL